MDLVNEAVAPYIGDDKCVGAVTLCAQGGTIVHFAAHGYLEKEQHTPMPLDAIFRIYSMTKPITSVALMILVDRGLLQLDDAVATYLPTFADMRVLESGPDGKQTAVACQRPLTIAGVLSHSAGFDYRIWETTVGALYRERGVWDVEKTLAETIDILSTLPLAYQPGSSWQYSVSPDVAARLVEVVAGTAFPTFLQEMIFDPLGMTDTGFFVPEEKHDRFTSLYGAADWALPDVTARLLGEEAQRGTHRLLATAEDSLESTPHDVIRGGTGLVTTARDYFRFCQMLLNQGTLEGSRILRPECVRLMTINQLSAEAWRHFSGTLQQPGQGFGYGFRVLLDPEAAGMSGAPGEFSWWGAANSSFWIDPVRHLVGVQMSQFMPPNHFPLPDAFKTAVYQGLPGDH